MSEKGIYDQAVEELIRLRGLMGVEIIRRNKGKRPFRMEPISKDEQIANYMTTDDEVKDNLRQQFPEYTAYEQDMLKKMEGLGNG